MPKGGNGNGNGNGNGGNGGGGSQDPKIVDQAFTTLENPLDGTSLGFVTADASPHWFSKFESSVLNEFL